MMLTPANYAFGVGIGKFIRHMVSNRGIEANPDKIEAIIDVEPPETIRDNQKLTGRIDVLGRLISKHGDKCLPFFKTLTKMKDYQWTIESQRGFEEFKNYMARAPLLAKPSPGNTMYIYLTISEKSVSAVLIKEEDNAQKPVYYVNKVLNGVEIDD